MRSWPLRSVMAPQTFASLAPSLAATPLALRSRPDRSLRARAHSVRSGRTLDGSAGTVGHQGRCGFRRGFERAVRTDRAQGGRATMGSNRLRLQDILDAIEVVAKYTTRGSTRVRQQSAASISYLPARDDNRR